MSILSEPINVVEGTARVAARAIETAELSDYEPDLSRTEIGSIDGLVTNASTYYNKPAISLRERLTGQEVVCVISDALMNTIGAEHNWLEVWTSRRLLVSGEIKYKRDGKIERVFASRIRNVEPKRLRSEDVADPSFTGGLSPTEYVELSRRLDGG